MLLNTLTKKEHTSSDPIGIFDSGVGGLSILTCIKNKLPNEKLIYIADSLYAPYGDKSDENIIERVNLIVEYLIKQNCKAVVVACNTATVVAIDQLRKQFTIPIIGIEPAIKPAVSITENNNIGILTTQATAKNQRFLSLVNKYKVNTNVLIQACPGLVELIEKNQLNSLIFKKLLQQFLNELLKNNVDTIVLGCTHYPFFSNNIKSILGNKIKIVETALPVTQQLERQLIMHQLINTEPLIDNNQDKFLSTQATSALCNLMSSLANSPVNLLPLTQYELTRNR